MINNKVVLITGASSGIGEATAIRLKKAGYVVYAGARRIDKMKHLAEQGIFTLNIDVTDDKSMTEAIKKIINTHNTIDILINNAGYGSYGALEDVPLSEGKYQFEVNVFGMARLTQLVLPYMRKNSYGKIVNISSIGGKTHEQFGSWYHSTKYAVEGLSDCLRLEVKNFGIDVIIIEPGGTKSEWTSIAAKKLIETSGKTAYGQLVEKYIDFFTQGGGSDPDIIAKEIEKSLISKKPKTRYVAGLGAKPFLFLRKILSDKLYDMLWIFLVNIMSKKLQKNS